MENWIWTELLAFDNTSSDLGVKDYFAECGKIPTGISLLLSAIDFVVLHRGMDTEHPLFPDVCTRFGHDGNTIRTRQNWTNHQLLQLVRNIQNHGTKVFFSVFPSYLHDRFHQEWASEHNEVFIYYDDIGVTSGINVLARLKNGTFYEDIFSEKLKSVMVDYGFDGFHGPDGLGPGGVIAHNDCSDAFIGQFADYFGVNAPKELRMEAGNDIEKLSARMKYIWENHRANYILFNIKRWTTFWEKIIGVLKTLGKESMMNSAWTKSAFESIYIYGIDYRPISVLGLDYLVVETVAGNLAMINGGHDFHFDFAATLAEMKAFLPEVKVIFLHGVKDVVESYDLLKHAPGRLEREFFTLSNTYINNKNHLERCADGFLVCLGDGLLHSNWEYLRGIWETGFEFAAEKAGDITWLWDETILDGLLREYPELGTWPGFKQIGALSGIGRLNVQTIARFEELENLSGALIVPNADLLPRVKLEKLKEYQRGIVVLIGNFDEKNILPKESCVFCRIRQDYNLCCRIIGGKSEKREVVDMNPGYYAIHAPQIYFWNLNDYMPIPDEFWKITAALINENLNLRINASPECPDLRFLKMSGQDNIMRVALISDQATYLSPSWICTDEISEVTKRSSFPYISLAIKDNSIYSNTRFSALHIPPFGTIIMDLKLIEKV